MPHITRYKKKQAYRIKRKSLINPQLITSLIFVIVSISSYLVREHHRVLWQPYYISYKFHLLLFLAKTLPLLSPSQLPNQSDKLSQC